MLKGGPLSRCDYGNVFSASEAGERCHDESTGKSAQVHQARAAGEKS